MPAPPTGLPPGTVDSQGELSLHGIWALARAVHGFCEAQRYPLWRFRHENHDDAAVDAWHQSFRHAMHEWAEVRVWVETFEASWGGVSRPWLSEAECLCSQRLASRPFRNPWTLELKDAATGGSAGTGPPAPMRLAELLQTRHGVDGLIYRLDRKCVAPYEAIDLPPRVDETARNRRLWTTDNGEIYPLALAWPDLSGFGSNPARPSPVLLPREWGAVEKRWGCLGPLRLQGPALIRVHDASGRAGVVRLIDMDDSLPGKVVGDWVLPCQWHYLQGSSSSAPVYEAAQTLAPDARGEVVCDLLDVLTGARLNPAGIKVLAGTLGHEGCIAINEAGDATASRRVDLMSLAGRVMHGPPDAGRETPPQDASPDDLRWSKIFASSEGLHPVQSPLSGLWGYIDDTGAVVIEPQFARAWFFSADRAEASPTLAPALAGLIDRQGQWAIAPRWRSIHPQNRRQFVVQDADDQWGAVDGQGSLVVALQPRASWSKDGAALTEDALIEGIACQWHEHTRQRVQAALHTPSRSLAALEGLFDRDARQRDLALAGVWGMHVRLIADQDGGILAPRAGETGWISTQYPVGLSCFDLGIQAPVCGLATGPDAVIGVLWKNLEAVHRVPGGEGGQTATINALRFFDPRDPATGYLSNFYRAPFTLDGLVWPTVEHYYQARKFADPAYAERIRTSPTPAEAKRLGQTRDIPLRADWDGIKRRTMLRALASKFLDREQGELLRRLIETRSARLLEASPTDSWWGIGADGQGANHLGRILMALRDALPQAEHEWLQGIDGGPLDEDFVDRGNSPPDLSQRAAHSFMARCLQVAWGRLQDADAGAVSSRAGDTVLIGPLYGQGIRQIRERLRPFLGHALLSGQVRRPHEDDQYNDRSHHCFDIGTAALAFAPSPAFPPASDDSPVSGLYIARNPQRRMGGRLELVESLSVHWDTHDSYDFASPPCWETVFGQPSPSGEPATQWQLAAAWVIPSPGHDELTRLHHQPAAYALCLELEPLNNPARHVHAGRDMHHPAVFLSFFARHDEGFDPQVSVTDHWPGNPYGPPWELLLCSPGRGALPRLEAAFAEAFSTWGIELPAEQVALRHPMPALDDGCGGLTTWHIRCAFGSDASGEYLDVDSEHRLCGECHDRIYADGRQLRRAGEIPESAFSSPVVGDDVVTDAQEAAVAQRRPGRRFRRALGVVTMCLGGWIGFVLAQTDPHPAAGLLLALVIILSGATMVCYPDER